MHIHLLVNTFGQDLLHRYGEKIHKLTFQAFQLRCPLYAAISASLNL